MLKSIFLAENAPKFSFLPPKRRLQANIPSVKLVEATFCQFSEIIVDQGLSKGSNTSRLIVLDSNRGMHHSPLLESGAAPQGHVEFHIQLRTVALTTKN